MPRRSLRRHMVAQAYLLVVLIHKHQLRLMLGHLVFMHLCERRNDQQVTHAGAACGRAVDRNHARATFALDGVPPKDSTENSLFRFGLLLDRMFI